MKIVSWNINGVKARRPYLELFLDAHQPDVLCVQELKSPTDKVPTEVFTERGYQLAIFGQKSWNGVLIASKFPMTNIVTGLPDNGHEDQSRAVAATINGIRVINLYCPQGQSADSEAFAFKKRFYDRLYAWIDSSCGADQELIVTGDFNIAPHPVDVYDPSVFENVPTRHPEELTRWAKQLKWGLSDLSEGHLSPGTYTFWDYRRGAFQRNMGMRIDHFIGTASIKERTEGVSVIRDFRKKKEGLTASDHAPIELVIRD